MASHVLHPSARRRTLGGVAQVPSLRRCPSVFSTTQKKTAMHLHHGLTFGGEGVEHVKKTCRWHVFSASVPSNECEA